MDTIFDCDCDSVCWHRQQSKHNGSSKTIMMIRLRFSFGVSVKRLLWFAYFSSSSFPLPSFGLSVIMRVLDRNHGFPISV
jgi:hypothetical protein